MRSYGDRCGVARALDLVGERWALLVVRELLLGPKRFTDLRAGLPGVGADVLAQRLRDLEAAGILLRRALGPPAGTRVYELTEWGRELEPIVLGLGRWGSRAPFPEGADAFSPDSFVIALKTLFEAGAARDAETYELALGADRFRLDVRDGRLAASRGAAEAEPDALVLTDPATLAGVLWHGREAGEDELVVQGRRDAVQRLRRLFPAPAPV